MPSHITRAPKSRAAQLILQLPFVRDERDQRPSGFKRNFWSVRPNGLYWDECLIGQGYARHYLALMRQEPTNPLLGWIALDMREAEPSGIEIGFFAEISRALTGRQG